jgi:CBS domain-containing protein
MDIIFMAVLVKDEMNRNVKTVAPDDTVKSAAEKMSKYWLGSLIVVENGGVVGIITERDILSKVVVFGKGPEKVRIKEIMSKNVITIDENKTLEEAIRLMKANDIKKLPVMKGAKLAGIITTTDIITGMDKQFEEEGVSSNSLTAYRDLKVLVRRHSIDVKRETEKNQILTFLISNSLYPTDSISIIKAVTGAISKPVFVTINKPYFSLVKMLKAKGIDPAVFYFIDASSSDDATSKGKNYEKIDPANMTELLLIIEKCLQTNNYDGLIFDSISTLLAYQEEEMVIRFARSLIGKLRKTKVKGIFLCAKDDLKTSLMKNLNMLADYSVDIEKSGNLD